MTGYAVFVRSTHPNAGAWVSTRKKSQGLKAVYLIENATQFERKKDAEALAVFVAATYPHVIGRVEIIESPAWQDQEHRTLRWHDFTVNHNG